MIMKIGKINKKGVIFAAIGLLVFIAIIVALVFAYKVDKVEERGAVVTNGYECAGIGKTILSQGGSAVDAAIAALFCEGLTCPQSMGLGGGFFATIYTKEKHKVETLIAREVAPIKADKNMFKNVDKITGGISVAVPGELKGYWELHKEHGKLPWSNLVQPTIDLALKGHRVSDYLASSLERYKDIIKNETHNFQVYINPKTNEVWEEGDIMTQPDLAATLRVIAEQGEDAIYNGGEIGKTLIEDIKKMGGIIEENDLLEYKTRWGKPIKAKVDDKHTLYTVPLPASGIVLSFILNLLDLMKTNDQLKLHQRIVESFKHGYGQRTKLGDAKFVPEVAEFVKNLEDPEFIKMIRKKIYDNMTFTEYEYYGANFSQPEDHGTANLAVLAPNGDAIVVTSTINTIFGAKFRSRTGIILNDEMDDFSTPGKVNGFGIPASPSNFIAPHKMPMSSMCPAIIVDENGDVKLLVGAAGGSKITTSVALVIIRYLILNKSLNESIQGDRLHHQLAPMQIQFEGDFDPKIISYLHNKINHTVDVLAKGGGFAAVTAIGNLNNELSSVYDRRRKGSSAVYINDHFLE